jgi:hypothetical protein
MCDYSLARVDTRLAQTGDELSPHNFGTGTIGLASFKDLARPRKQDNGRGEVRGIVRQAVGMFTRVQPQNICAICVPPGAKPLVSNIPQRIQQMFDSPGCYRYLSSWY